MGQRGLLPSPGSRGGVFPAPSLKTRQSGRRLAGASNGRSLFSIDIAADTAPLDDFHQAAPTRPNQQLLQDQWTPATSASSSVNHGGSQRHLRHPQATLQNSTLPSRRSSSHFDTKQNHSFSARSHHKKSCVSVSSYPYPRLDLLRAHRERRLSCALPCALR